MNNTCPVCGQHIHQCERCGGIGMLLDVKCDQCENGLLIHSDAFHLMNYQRALKNVEELIAENTELKRIIQCHYS